MAPHDFLEDPLVEVLGPVSDPIADQSGPGGRVSPNIPLGVSLFGISDASMDPHVGEPVPTQSGEFQERAVNLADGSGPLRAPPKPIHRIGPASSSDRPWIGHKSAPKRVLHHLHFGLGGRPGRPTLLTGRKNHGTGTQMAS